MVSEVKGSWVFRERRAPLRTSPFPDRRHSQLGEAGAAGVFTTKHMLLNLGVFSFFSFLLRRWDCGCRLSVSAASLSSISHLCHRQVENRSAQGSPPNFTCQRGPWDHFYTCYCLQDSPSMAGRKNWGQQVRTTLFFRPLYDGDDHTSYSFSAAGSGPVAGVPPQEPDP